VVFPRTSVWIRHEGSKPFVADPTVVTIYNRAQRYERAPLSPDGDRCDWFAVSDQTARDIVGAFDPGAAEQDRGPFRFQRVPNTPSLYLAQRRLVQGAETGVSDALKAEEAIVDIVARVLALAYQRVPQPLECGTAARRRRQDLVELAKAEIVRTVTVNRSVDDLARTVGTSVFHLCRIFRTYTGRTMHEYRSELRVRLALELLSGARTRGSLSNVAHHLGFASHSHFVRLCQRKFGVPPKVVREQLRVAV
jgi:AraC-like DNA-binding protein